MNVYNHRPRHHRPRHHRSRHHRLRRRSRVRAYIKIFTILAFCIVGLITAGKLRNIYTSNNAPNFWGTSNLTSISNEENIAEGSSISVDVTAVNACVINADSNAVLCQKNSTDSIAPASTAKILAALTVLDYYALNDVLTVGKELDLVASDASRAWLYQGDVLTVKQLLTALLLPSGNDAAYTLAANTGKEIAGNDGLTTQQYIETFMAAMNKKAKEIGATSSIFITPDGYDAAGQYTTAYDFTQIAKACLSNSCLAEIMSSFMVSDTWANGREVTYYNTNELLNPDSTYYYPDAIGLKTGNSSEAGACLVSAAIINGETYICVIMGTTEEARFLDSINIYNELKTL